MDIARRRLVALLYSYSLRVSAQTQPEFPVSNLLPGARRIGQGDLSYFGFRVYRAQLWSRTGNYDPDQVFLLALSYQSDIARGQIVEASFEQMGKLGLVMKNRQESERQLFAAFRDVRPGDTLAGVFYPGKGASFYFNNTHTGDLDPDLARNLAAIWLDPKTSQPELRRALLGENR